MSCAINLLPAHLRPPRGLETKHVLVCALTGVLLICGGLWGVQCWREQQAERELGRIAGEMLILQPVLQQVRKNKELEAGIASRAAVLTRIKKERPVKWSDIIWQLGQTVPDNLWLTELTSDVGGNINVKGGAKDIATVGRYAASLRQVPNFTNVTFQGLALNNAHDKPADIPAKAPGGPAANFFSFGLSISVRGER
ncbi:MAG TPA: PilN domain-containing protein [Negativicutes bacterium]|nr:PilN domain-containing protein [Negativicutes bacterium]